MGGFFKIDGPFYKYGNILYYLIVTNMMWVIFSLPLFTIGASTTALNYVMGKIVRDEDVSPFKDFWKSFKGNFGQATIVSLILGVLLYLLYFNIRNMGLMGNSAKFFMPVQVAVLLELVVICVYIFPLLSRYELKIKDLFRLSFFMGNRHIFSTLTCLASLGIIVFLFLRFTGLFILVFISLYTLINYYIIFRVFKKYMPQEKEIELQKQREAEEE